MEYDFPLFRPPSEARSLIFQVALGCSLNWCRFYTSYGTNSGPSGCGGSDNRPDEGGNNNPVITPRPDPENGIAASDPDKISTIFRSVIVISFGNVCCR